MKKTSFITILLGLVSLGCLAFFAKDAGEGKAKLLNHQAIARVEQTNSFASDGLQTKLSDSISVMRGVGESLAEADEELLFSYESIRSSCLTLTGYGFLQASLCDTEGEAYDATGASFYVSECKYYQRALAGDNVIAFHSYKEDEKPSVVLHLPVHEKESGAVVAVLRADFGIDVLRSTLATSEYRGKESVVLINQAAGTVMSLSGAFSDRSVLSLWDSKSEDYRKMEQLIKQGKSNTEFMTDKDGVRYVISYKGIRKVNDWGVVTLVRTKDLLPLLSDTYYGFSDYLTLIFAAAFVVLLLWMLLSQARKRYQMEYMANVDHITKSYNFKGFARRMALAFEKDTTSKYAFLEVTLDRFEYFKETFGNDETNRTLLFLSKMIGGMLRSDEAYCRYNTMFFILLIKYQSEEELKERIIYLKDKVSAGDNDRLHEKFTYNLLVGVYTPVKPDIGVDEMIHFADTALMEAQTDYGAPYVFYRAAMDVDKSESKELEQEMYNALEEREFLVYLQPKFSLKDGKQTGAEALVRWRHPQKGLLYPGRFIPLFEKNGFITEMDMYIFEELCRRIQRWIRKGRRPLPLSINISMHNLYSEGFVSRLEEIIHKYGIPASLIILEFSEEAIAGNIKLTCDILEQLKNIGFSLSMDDFGRSATAMNTLYQTKVDEVKIDRKFLMDNEKTERGQSIINTVFETAKRLQINVVGEGVTDKRQARLLQELGCDMMQGFAFAEPLPEHEYEEYAYGARAAENKISV